MRSLSLVAFLAADFLIGSCATKGIAGPLSRVEAVRLADAEAKRNRIDLRSYERSPVLYFAKDGHWYIGYQKKGHKFVDFGIDVYDKTKKADLIIAN
jgi:hypothetical protein